VGGDLSPDGSPLTFYSLITFYSLFLAGLSLGVVFPSAILQCLSLDPPTKSSRGSQAILFRSSVWGREEAAGLSGSSTGSLIGPCWGGVVRLLLGLVGRRPRWRAFPAGPSRLPQSAWGRLSPACQTGPINTTMSGDALPQWFWSTRPASVPQRSTATPPPRFTIQLGCVPLLRAQPPT